ncbi:MAG: PQQ-binding-like beta-propeller repeat protein [Planctomycetota bacterium]
MIIATTTLIPAFSSGEDWLQFRGPGGTSAIIGETVPTEFDDEKNIGWKTDLPAKGASSPIVVGGNVIVTCSGGDQQEQLYTVCLNAADGNIKWTQKYWATGRTLCHPLSANAAPTPASDGKQVYSFFSSNDLACTDLDGNLIWFRGLGFDYPKAGNDVGMSASPIVHDGVVVVVVESQGASFAMGLDTENGETIWKVDREKTASWTSPVVVPTKNGAANVAILSSDRLTVLDLKSGELVEDFEGEGNVIPSPMVTQGLMLAPIDGTTAYSLDSDTPKKLWNSEQVRMSTSSLVAHVDKLYTMNRGVIASFNLKTGEQIKKARVGGNYWSTPVIVGDYLYSFAQDGTGYVVDLNDDLKVVHKHQFKDEVMLGSPAVSKGAMYIRSDKSIWKITDTSGPTS